MLIRLPLAMILGTVAYMIAMVMTVYDGPLSLIFQPIIAIILAGIAAVVLLVLGSPLLHPRIWSALKHVWWLPAIIATLGVLAMIASWHPSLRVGVWDPELRMQVESFHP